MTDKDMIPTLSHMDKESFGSWGLMLFLVGAFNVLVPSIVRGAESPGAISPTNSIKLFNGSDLTGFHTWLVDTQREDPRRIFLVTNGMIHISGEGLGYLSTDREYKNYRLIVEFRWGQKNWHWGDRIGKARDSGIFLHSVGPDGNSQDGKGAFKAAIECQIMQGAVGDFLLIRGKAADGSLIAPRLTAEVAEAPDADGWFTRQQGGRRQTIKTWGRLNWQGKAGSWQDVLDFRGPNDVEIAATAPWTRIECLCDGERIRVMVNGATVNEAFDVFPSAGKILLQCEGSEIFFRRVELHPLGVSSKTNQPPKP